MRDHGGMAEIAIVSVHTGLKNRYLCSLRATPGIVEAAYRNKAPRASAGAVVGWGPLLANCSEPHASVGDITLRQLGIQAGSTTTVHAELCARVFFFNSDALAHTAACASTSAVGSLCPK